MWVYLFVCLFVGLLMKRTLQIKEIQSSKMGQWKALAHPTDRNGILEINIDYLIYYLKKTINFVN